MNETIVRFGFPATLVADYDHWVVLLRPAQPTLGSLVLAAKGEYLAFADLPAAAFEELRDVVGAIESSLAQAVGHKRINYLMLMMVDPHVHFHVVPRYKGERSHGAITIGDAGWPKAPDLGSAMPLDPAEVTLLAGWLKALWPA